MTANREICKWLECSVDKFAVTPADHLFSKVSHGPKHNKKFCFHSYAKEINLEALQQLEKSSLLGSDYGLEVTAVLDNITMHYPIALH